MKLIDLTGKRFGRLIVKERSGTSKSGVPLWRCVCDCGKETLVRGQSLRDGITKSCGCLHEEMMKNFSDIGKRNIKHGKSFSRLYDIWACMKTRCYNRKHRYFSRYGGRGISVCDSWRSSFEAFYKWSISNGYDDGLTLDRINNDGDYEPSNCRWATKEEQAKNKENSRTFQGKSPKEWAEIVGLSRRTIEGRLQRGWSWEDAIKIPFRGVRRYSDHCRQAHESEMERSQLPKDCR